jgi:hypothetical protein
MRAAKEAAMVKKKPGLKKLMRLSLISLFTC